MSFAASYAISGQKRPESGPRLATNSGYLAWVEWAVKLPGTFPRVKALAKHGDIYPADELDRLEEELAKLAGDPPDSPSGDIQHVTAKLLEAVKERPADCVGLLVG